MHNSEYIRSFMERYDYPELAVTTFTAVEDELDANPAFAEKFDALVAEYSKTDCPDRGAILRAVDALAEEREISPYTLQFVLLMNASEALREHYAEQGVDESVFWDSMDDLRCKLIECINCKEVAGTFVGGWFGGFYDMRMFKYGRFEYHLTEFNPDVCYTTKCGIRIKRGDTLVNMHIPSTGVPLTDEVRLDSYKRAYRAFKKYFPGDSPVIFVCGSWLLYPKHVDFLPASSNILKFLSDFEIVCWEDREYFGDAWRVFDKYADLPPEELPRNTSLRRAFADRLSAGEPTGSGYGVIVFDGEKIVR